MSPGVQESSAKITKFAAVRVIPELPDLIEITAALMFLLVWKFWTFSPRICWLTSPWIRMWGMFLGRHF